MNFIYILFLGFAVSLDSFAAGVSYGLKNIRMPFKSLAVVFTVTAAFTGVAMFFAGSLSNFFDVRPAMLTGSLLLIALGAFSLFQELFTAEKQTAEPLQPVRQVTFSLGKLVISIMAKPETADIDQSKSISPAEALFLGVALGIDNLVATFAAGLICPLPLYTPLLMGFIQSVLMTAGSFAGRHLVSGNWKRRFPLLPGTILILIGLIRLS